MKPLFRLCLWLLLCPLLASCGEEEYYYPSVKLEFLTAYSGADGMLQSVRTDDGRLYPLQETVSGLVITPDSLLRIVSNYELQTDADGTGSVRLYALSRVVSPLPLPSDKFEKGILTHPVSMQSIWLGCDYLNMILNVKAQDGSHRFHFIEDEVTTDEATGHTRVCLTLYHDDGGDTQAYTQRAYLSVPLWKYAAEGVERVTVRFTWHTYEGGTDSREIEYIPR